MKLKTISRSYEEASRGSKNEIHKVHKNADPKLHPFEKAREYTRAVTAAKMDRMFAAPFLGALPSEHSDGVYCSATNPKSLVSFVSGSADGEVIVWDLASKTKLWSVVAHTGFVRGLTVSSEGDYFFSCGDDKRIRQWRLASNDAVAAALTDGAGGAIAGSKRAGSGRLGGGGPAGGAKRARHGDDEDDDDDAEDDDEDDEEEEEDDEVEEDDDDEYAALLAGARSSSGPSSSSSSSSSSGAAAGAGRASYAAQEDLDTRKRYGQASSGTLGRLAAGAKVSPVATWSSPTGSSFLSIDHHYRDSLFVTCGPSGLDVWDPTRSAPKQSYSWGSDSVTTCKWNPAESGLIASTGADRSVVLYDVRTDSALRKVVFSMSNNALAWNPREPMTFTTANEDSNCYSFDMRRLDKALMVHKDHTMAVMDLCYSPTGKEFVTGSYDRTIRIFKVDSGKSRDLYHLKRMQRVFTVKYTGDARFILSGSDDTNVRIWKAQASATLGRTLPRERAKLDYSQALLKRFGHMPEVKKIMNSSTSHHAPKGIRKAKEQRLVDEQKERRKLANIRAHTAPGSKEGIPEAARKKAIVGEVK